MCSLIYLEVFPDNSPAGLKLQIVLSWTSKQASLFNSCLSVGAPRIIQFSVFWNRLNYKPELFGPKAESYIAMGPYIFYFKWWTKCGHYKMAQFYAIKLWTWYKFLIKSTSFWLTGSIKACFSIWFVFLESVPVLTSDRIIALAKLTDYLWQVETFSGANEKSSLTSSGYSCISICA